jgi:transcriptional pleiotropic regulator of transition state genes
MKNTGIIRKLDELGRIVLPKELRDSLSIQEGDKMEIYVDKRKIVLKKFENKICEKCSASCEGNSSFCNYCGTRLEKRNYDT